MTKPASISAEMGTPVTAHALYIGDRINTMGFEGEVLSALPLEIPVGKAGVGLPPEKWSSLK
jgi:required for meiotic nuclear division protein 1